MSQAHQAIEVSEAASAAEKLKRICVHVSPKHLADAKRLSQVLRTSDGKKLTAAAVLRLAQDKGLELLLQEQTTPGSLTHIIHMCDNRHTRNLKGERPE